MIGEGIAAGQFQPVDADKTARQLAGLIDGLAIHSSGGDLEVPTAQVCRLCVDYLQTVLQPRQGTAHAG